MNAPNIFSFATSELSQDAVIAWIVMWADKEHRESNPAMAACAEALIYAMMGMDPGESGFVINEVKASLQWKSIDVLIEINGAVVITVEDKAGSHEHSDQLNRYRTVINEDAKFQNYEKHFVYFKTYNQCRTELNEIVQDRMWRVLIRQDLMRLIGPYRGSHALLDEFMDHLGNIEARYDFRDKTFRDLKRNGDYWIGLYDELLDRKVGIRWHRVNNVNGGFWNLLLTWQQGREDDVVYLQLEEHFLQVKLKISHVDEGVERGIDDYRKSKAMLCRKQLMNHPVKPDGITKTRFKKGEYMTLARLDIVKQLGGDESVVNIDELEALLRGFIEWIDQVNIDRGTL